MDFDCQILASQIKPLLAKSRNPRQRAARKRFESELSYGRASGPAPSNARPAAVLVLIYPGDAGGSLPLTLRPTHLPSHGGQISLPGGIVEPGETSREGALRELEEELGVPPEDVRILGSLAEVYVFSSNCRVVPWVGSIDREPVWKPQAEEVAEVLHLSLHQLMNPSHWTTTSRHLHGVSFRAPYIALGRHEIWGATAMILGELISVLE